MENDNTPWIDSLPEPLRDAPFIGKADSMDDAISKLAHAAQLVGTSLRIPDADASDDAKAEFYAKLQDVPGVAKLPTPDDQEGLNALLAKLGRPEKADEYALPELDGFEWDEGISSSLKQYAMEAGLTKQQFQTLATQIGEQESTAGREAQTQLEASRQALRQEWGEATTEREDLIRGWLQHSNAPESLQDLLNTKNLPVDAMNWLHDTAKQFKGEVTPVGVDGADNASPSMTPQEARSKIQDIVNNPAYFDSADPRQKDLVDQMLTYQKLANPEAAA